MSKDVIGPGRVRLPPLFAAAQWPTKRTRSKWSRLMRYADERKLNSEPLDQFIKQGRHQCLRYSFFSASGARCGKAV
jgi:hypothetical protein